MASLNDDQQSVDELRDSIDALRRHLEDQSRERVERGGVSAEQRIDRAARTIDASSRAMQSTTRAITSGLVLAGTGAAIRADYKRGGVSRMLTSGLQRHALGTMMGGAAARGGMMGSILRGGQMIAGLNPYVRLAMMGIAIAGGVKALRGDRRARSGGTDMEVQKQTALLSRLVQESVRTRQSVADVAVANVMAADPFRRSFASSRQRAMAMGAVPTPLERSNIPYQATLEQNTEMARQAAERAKAGRHPGITGLRQAGRTVYEQFRTGIHRTLTRREQLPTQPGPADQFFAPFNDMFTRMANSQLQAGRTAQQQRLIRSSALDRLMMEGPGNVMTPTPTIRAGTDAAYRHEYMQERRAMQTQMTREWQDKVLTLLQEMVRQAEAGPDDLARMETRFGRPLTFFGVE